MLIKSLVCSFARRPSWGCTALLATLVFLVAVGKLMANTNENNRFVIDQTWDGNALPEDQLAEVTVHWLDNGDLQILIDAPFANDPKPECSKTECWELWNYEVVELFLLGSGDSAPYTEIEVSPWGNHLVLQLEGMRNAVATMLPLDIKSLTRGETRWQAEAVLGADLIPAGDLKVNAYRVSGVEPNRHYHVMSPMVSEQPDFHLIDQFVRTFQRPE